MNTALDNSSKDNLSAPSPLLNVRNLTKMFDSLAANEDVSLDLAEGEIHALLGENGAGKSTFVKMIYGSLQPTSGDISWRGEPLVIDNPTKARSLGIGMVFQHFSLFEALTITENIALALPEKFDLVSLAKKIKQVSAEYGLPLEPTAIVADLSVGERQRIEIVRCLLQNPKLLIMDEPTAVLTPQEAQKLFKTLERLSTEGCAILYISHRLDEVKQLCSKATILRHGRVVAQVDPREHTTKSLAGLMVGEDIHLVSSSRQSKRGKEILKLTNLSTPANDPFGVDLKQLNLSVHSGEVVAIAGVAGNGQRELFEILSGERLTDRDDMISLNGKNIGDIGITRRRRMGAAFVPEERLGHGAVPGLSLTDNVILSRHATRDGIIKSGILRTRRAEEIQHNISKNFDVRKSKANPEAHSLSGGNLQKFVVGRELDRNPDLLIINQPTWGVDVGAAALIRQRLIDLAANGSAVLVISQDLDEIFEIADQIAVISRGELSTPVPASELTAENIGLMMAGSHEKQPVDTKPATNTTTATL